MNRFGNHLGVGSLPGRAFAGFRSRLTGRPAGKLPAIALRPRPSPTGAARCRSGSARTSVRSRGLGSRVSATSKSLCGAILPDLKPRRILFARSPHITGFVISTEPVVQSPRLPAYLGSDAFTGFPWTTRPAGPRPPLGRADRGRYFRAMFMTLISDDGSLSDFQT